MGKARSSSRRRDTSVDQAATDQMVNAIHALAIAMRMHIFPSRTSAQYASNRRRVREELETAQRAVERALVYTKG